MSKVAVPGALQLVLFELDDRSQSHLIALYDLAPRYVFASRDGSRSGEVVAGKGSFMASVKREFEYRGSTFHLTVQPARLSRVVKDAAADEKPAEVEYEVFPAEREQVVEHVVRRLAMDRSRLSLGGENQDKVQMRFTLYEIQRELRAVGHTLSIRDIRESLTILARSRIIIAKPGDGAKKGRGANLLESTAFPVLAIRSRPDLLGDEGGDEETHLQFNPLVSAAIRNLEFKPVSYHWLMRLKNPVSRWLYNHLSALHDNATSGGKSDPEVAGAVSLTADEIVKNSGMNVWSRRRDTLRAVSAAVDALVEEGILDSVEKLYTKKGARIDDITYVMLPSGKFLAQVRRSEAVVEANVAAMRVVAGDGHPNGFVPVTPAAAVEARRRRAGQLARQEAETAPLLLTGGH